MAVRRNDDDIGNGVVGMQGGNMQVNASVSASAGANRGVVFAPLVYSDLDDVIEAFDAVWGLNGSTSQCAAVSRLLSAHSTYRYLAPSTYAEVARMDGKFLGVLMTRVPGRLPLFPKIDDNLDQVDAQLDETELGRTALADVERGFDIGTELERESGVDQSCQAEVELFLVAGAARGHGVGGGLWSRAMHYLSHTGVQRFYLHTDSDCDVSFYDAHGMDCVASRRCKALRQGESSVASAHRSASGEGLAAFPSAIADEMFVYVGDPHTVAQSAGRPQRQGAAAQRGGERGKAASR